MIAGIFWRERTETSTAIFQVSRQQQMIALASVAVLLPFWDIWLTTVGNKMLGGMDY